MASTKVSAMAAATNLTSSVIPIVQGGVNKKAADTLFVKNDAVNQQDIRLYTATQKNIQLIVDNGGGTQASFVVSSNPTTATIDVDSQYAGFRGIEYVQDFTANFVDRSLADKGYVDTAVSDARLKENVTDLPPSLGLIDRLRPVEFDFIKSKEHKAGFIAQELEEVFPGMVIETELGVKKIKRDQLVPYLVKCIQELNERVKILESK